MQGLRLTIGLDLGDRSSFYCVLDEAGQVIQEQKVSTTPKAVKDAFAKMPPCRIALETGTHSPWVSRSLSELGHEVIVANARNIRLIGESRKKDDRLDAQTLARLARIDPQLLSPVQHRSAQAQADLEVIRARAGLVPRAPSGGLIPSISGESNWERSLPSESSPNSSPKQSRSSRTIAQPMPLSGATAALRKDV
jgi:hypothetical protein